MTKEVTMKDRIVSFFVIAAALLAAMGFGGKLSSAQTSTQAPTLSITRQPTAVIPIPNDRFVRGIALKDTTVDGVPPGIDQAAWEDAFGTIVTPDPAFSTDNLLPVVIRMGNLAPDGNYSVWWGDVGAPTTIRALPNTPNNQFQADEHGNARFLLNLNLRTLGQRLTFAVIYHANNNIPPGGFGKLGVDSFRHLVSAFPDTRGTFVAGTRVPTATALPTVTMTPSITTTASITSTASMTSTAGTVTMTGTAPPTIAASASATTAGTLPATSTQPASTASVTPVGTSGATATSVPSMTGTAAGTGTPAATASATP
jgi:hypothetical protein